MIPEEHLKQAVEEVEQTMLKALPAEEASHDFSLEFEQKMQKLCKVTERPRVYTFLKHAACAVLAIVLLCGCLMLNTEARASVVGWVSEQYCGFRRYFIDKPADVDRQSFGLGWLPDGYIVADEMATEDGRMFVYKKEGEPTIFFSYSYGYSSMLFVKEAEHIITQIDISGNPAELYTSIYPGKSSIVVWTDLEYGVLFYISSNCDQEILIKIAENIRPLD